MGVGIGGTVSGTAQINDAHSTVNWMSVSSTVSQAYGGYSMAVTMGGAGTSNCPGTATTLTAMAGPPVGLLGF